MGIKSVSTQLMIGKTEEASFTWAEIERKLLRAAEITGINRLMFWNAGSERNHDFIAGLCDKHGIELYAWFPVLADITCGRVDEESAQLNIYGTRGYGKSGRWSKIDSGEENFMFMCPSRSDAVGRTLRCLEEMLDKYEYDGVFLDRIRHPSFACGLESLFGCVCPDCVDAYNHFSGAGGEELKDGMRAVSGFLEAATAADLEKISCFEELFRISGYERIPAFRSDRIDRVVGRFSEAVRKRGLGIGLDLLSPSISAAVGQDYAVLQRHCDWIKLMTYCYANGPAGLPLEAVSLIKGLVELNRTGLTETEAVRFCSELLGANLGPDCETILSDGLDPGFVKKETEAAAALIPDARDKLIPGLELVNHPFFTPPISEKQCRGYMDVLEGMDCGIIACWNILYIPEAYLMMIKERMN